MSFFAEFAKALGGELRNSRRALVLASSEEDPEIERVEIRTLLDRGVDVLIIASCQPNLRNFYELGDDRTPYVLFDRNFPHLVANFVGSNDVSSARWQPEHLMEAAPKGLRTSVERIRAPRSTACAGN